MNLTSVLAFHKVAAARSFTQAARMSGVSQPTLSAQVRDLEQAVGTPLFHRDRRQIRLTEVGERLFKATARLAEAIDDVELALAEPRNEARGALRVSADSAVHVIPILAHLKRGTQKFSFSLRLGNSRDVTDHVLNREADVGIMARQTSDARLSITKLREDRLVLVAGRRDPWFERKRINLKELQGRDIIVREKGSITREVMDECLKKAGIAPGQMFDVGTREAVNEAVAAGFGVGVVFASETGTDARVRSLEILGADLSVGEYLICRQERRRIALIARFFDVALQLARSQRW